MQHGRCSNPLDFAQSLTHHICRFALSGIEPVLPVPDWSHAVVPEDLQRLSDEWFTFLAGTDTEATFEWTWRNGNTVQGSVQEDTDRTGPCR